MSPALQIPLWTLVGSLFGGLHLLLLHKSVQQALNLDVTRARRRILRGLPFRLVCWTPALVLAARCGPLACVSLILGSLLIRGLAWLLAGPRWSPAPVSRD